MTGSRLFKKTLRQNLRVMKYIAMNTLVGVRDKLWWNIFSILDRDFGALASHSSSEWLSGMSSGAMHSGSEVISSLVISDVGSLLPFWGRGRCPGVDCDRFRGMSELPSVPSFVDGSLGVLEGVWGST